jgi:hypothetical protein
MDANTLKEIECTFRLRDGGSGAGAGGRGAPLMRGFSIGAYTVSLLSTYDMAKIGCPAWKLI